MKKERVYTLSALLAVAGMVVSCKPGVEKEAEQVPMRPETSIKLMGNDAEYDIGTVPNDPKKLLAKEWLLQNTGSDTLYVDSVTVSCECVEMHYNDSMLAAPLQYFPVRAFYHPEGENGPFFREIKVYGNFPDSPLVLTIVGELVDADSLEDD